jgi:sortase A
MKITLRPKPFAWYLRCVQIALVAAGAGTLGYCAFVLADTWNFQREANGHFDPLHLRPAAPPSPGSGAMSSLVGRLEIPRVGLSVVVAEGADDATLRRAAGHIPGTALPGRSGNVGIAGHRDTLFRSLRGIEVNDMILLTTLQGEYHYRVVSTKVVDPSDVAVLNPDGGEILTLVTCYPFYFVGPAPDRFIVRAERVTQKHGDGI